MDSFVKKVTFKDDTGKKHSYIATFVKVDGGYKISDEDMKQINAAMGAKDTTWEDSSDGDLEKKADETKDTERAAAHLDAIDVAQDNGDGAGKAINDILESDAKSPEELNKKLNGDDAELYNDKELTALGNIANAIKDRWQ